MAIGFGQTKSVHAGSAVASVTTATATTATSGSGFVIIYQGAGTNVTVADSKSNSYIQIGASQTYNFSNRGAAAFYCPLGVGGAGHTATATYGSGSADLSVYFWEMTTGIGLGVGLDQATVANSSTLISTAYTTTQANELLYAVFCGASTNATATHTASGDSLSINANLDITNGSASFDSTGCVARRLVSATQSNVAVTFTEVGNSGGTMVMFGLSFYEASAITAWLTA